MKKTPIIIASVVAAGLVYQFWYKAEQPEQQIVNIDEQPQHDHSAHTQTRQPIATIGNGLSTGKDMFIADSPSEKLEEMGEVQENDTIVWTTSEEAEAFLKSQGQIPADVNNEAYVELDRDELLSVEVGEYLDLYIPQIGGSYTGEVDFIQVHENGDRTVEAYIPGAGKLYSAVITIGKEAVYGTLGTQADVYIMEGSGKYAWLAPKSDLVATHDKAHVDGVIPSGEVKSEDDGTFALGSN